MFTVKCSPHKTSDTRKFMSNNIDKILLSLPNLSLLYISIVPDVSLVFILVMNFNVKHFFKLV